MGKAKPRKTCSICLQRGHNRLTCQRRHEINNEHNDDTNNSTIPVDTGIVESTPISNVDPTPEPQMYRLQLERLSKVRLKSRKLRDHPFQPKASYAKRFKFDGVNCLMVIDDMGSFLEIAQNLVIGDDSTRAEQTIGARIGAGRIIISSIQLDHPYYTLSAGEDVGTADFSICSTSKKPIMKTVGTQTESECFCRSAGKHSARAKSMYEKTVLHSDIKMYIGKNQVKPSLKGSKRR
uniref:uncharacterized protein isoform X2 n=1 Tax=Myxine glutinosa TaxID=7769 RepID=UPI00358F03C0